MFKFQEDSLAIKRLFLEKSFSNKQKFSFDGCRGEREVKIYSTPPQSILARNVLASVRRPSLHQYLMLQITNI